MAKWKRYSELSQNDKAVVRATYRSPYSNWLYPISGIGRVNIHAKRKRPKQRST